MNIQIDDEVVVIGNRSVILGDHARQSGGIDRLLKTARSMPEENVMVFSGKVDGKVRGDGRGFNAQGPLQDATGSVVGDVLISWETLAHSKDDLIAKLPTPNISLDEQGPLPRTVPLTLGQAKFTMTDGSTLTAIGTGFSRMDVDRNSVGDTVAMEVTQGTGRFAGQSGLITVSGSVTPKAGQDFFGNPGASAEQHVIATFRLF